MGSIVHETSRIIYNLLQFRMLYLNTKYLFSIKIDLTRSTSSPLIKKFCTLPNIYHYEKISPTNSKGSFYSPEKAVIQYLTP